MGLFYLFTFTFNPEGVSVDWIDLAQDRDRWRVLVNAVMKLGFP